MDLGRGGRPTCRAMKASVEVLGQIEAEPDSRLATSTAEELNPAATFAPWILLRARRPGRSLNGHKVADAGPGPRTSAV